MTCRGIVRNGVIELLDSGALPEGAVVTVELPDEAPGKSSLLEDLGDLVGSIDNMPEDYALSRGSLQRSVRELPGAKRSAAPG